MDTQLIKRVTTERVNYLLPVLLCITHGTKKMYACFPALPSLALKGNDSTDIWNKLYDILFSNQQNK